MAAAQRDRDAREADRQRQERLRREALVQESRGEQAYERGIRVEEKRHQPRGGVLERGEIARRLPHVADRAHEDCDDERAPARPRPVRRDHHERQHRARGGKAREEQAQDIGSARIREAGEDRQRPERGGRKRDEQEA